MGFNTRNSKFNNFKFTLVFADTEFIQNKNATICKLAAVLVPSYDPNEVTPCMYLTFDNDIFNGMVFTGVAKCHENDNFNSTTGMRIAESRAKVKAYKTARNVLNKMFEDFDDFTSAIKYSTNSFKSLYESETEHLKKLTDTSK
jgi:hypothetical protein